MVFPSSPYTPLHNNEQCVRHVYVVAKRGRDRGARRKQKRLRVQAAETPVRAGGPERGANAFTRDNGSQTVGRPSSFGRRAYRGYRGPCRVRTRPCDRRDGKTGIGFSDFSPANAVTAVVTAAAENHWFGRCAAGRLTQSGERANRRSETVTSRRRARERYTYTVDGLRARVTGRSPGRTGLRIAVLFVRFILRPIAFRPSISECFVGKLFHLFRETFRNRSPVCRPVFLGRDTLCGVHDTAADETLPFAVCARPAAYQEDPEELRVSTRRRSR